MKIINDRSNKRSRSVNSCSPGTVVQFNKRFHQDYPPNELYITLDVCGSYREPRDFTVKQGIANLSTGKLSFVDGTREITVMNAEVKVDGPVTP